MPSLLIIGYVWPEPASSAAGRHMMEIIQTFLDDRWSITFATPAAESPHRIQLSELGIHEASIELNSDSFNQWLQPLKPDVVIFDRFMMEEQFGWRVMHTCPEAVRILDTEDLHFLRSARQLAARHGRQIQSEDLINEHAIREVASIYRSDLTLVISQTEQQLLHQQFNIEQTILQYFPFLTDIANKQCNDFKNRRDFIFVGTMRHAPNLDAIRRLKTILWPPIRQQLPQVNLYIVGAYTTREVSQMHKPAEGFHVLGRVDKLNELLNNSRVFIAPLLFGAGLKGKLLDAMEQGLPSVTTAIGAEGINGSMQWPGIIAEEDNDFVSAAVTLYKNEIYWDQCQQQGFSLLEARFLRKTHAANLLSRVQQIKSELTAHRQNNFIGMMLQHHTQRSTEYMSRWIACKNKKGDSA